MSILQAITLGIVQGLTEFLPISSTAHVRIVPALLGWPDPGSAFSAVIQCGTLLAVCMAMRQDISRLLQGSYTALMAGRPLETAESRIVTMIAFGTLPIVVVGLAARQLIRGQARDLSVVIAALLLGTIVMMLAEVFSWWRVRHGLVGRSGFESVKFSDGLTMGLMQVMALIPGTSRSGVTISSGMFTGLDRPTAARLSFLLSLPAVAAAGFLEAWQQRAEIFGSSAAITTAVLGTLAAALVGYLSIRWLLSMLASQTLWPFILYRLTLASLLGWSLAAGWLSVVA